MRRIAAAVVAAAAFFLPAAQAAGQGSGPDLLGLRIGMTPDEALQVLKARAPKEQWETLKVGLQYQNAQRRLVPLPNGELQAVIQNRFTAQPMEKYAVHMTPVPGRERVGGVMRRQLFALDARPLVDKTVELLAGKYGPPAARVGGSNGSALQLLWSFDAAGKPRGVKAGPPRFFPCTNSWPLDLAPHEVAKWGVTYQPQGDTGHRQMVPYADACGATIVRARIEQAGNGFAASLVVELIGHAAATEGAATMARIIKAAEGMDLAKEKEEAATRSRPDI